jgi:RNA-directed DNA polymerase
MTIDLHGSIGASSGLTTEWESIDWTTIRAAVRRLQMRIAKAIRETHHGKARALQWLLTHSYAAKLLAVKRVTENKGHNTPGVDGVVWRTDRQKLEAIQQLKRRGYQPQPLRRTYLTKKNGKLRPLSIPIMLDRAQQALHMFALQPVAETCADKNSYAFREGRSCADAIGQCFIALAKSCAPVWILEGDIKSCLDPYSYYTFAVEGWSNSCGWFSKTRMRKPFCFPRLTWTTSSSPRFTRCMMVCRDTPRMRMAWNTVT